MEKIRTPKNVECRLVFVTKQNDFVCMSIEGDFLGLTGQDPADILNGHLQFEEMFHVDDQDLANLIFCRTIQEPPLLLTYRVIGKNGQVKILRSCHERNFLIMNQEFELNIVLQDPIDLRENIADRTLVTNFIAMMETSDDYIYFKDRNHVFTGASQTLVKLTDPTEHWTDLIGKTDYEVFPRAFADIYYTLEKKVFSGAIPVAQEIQPTLDKNGNRGWVDNRKYPIRDKDGNIIGLFGIARDITRLITAEELARQAQLSTAILNSIEDGVVTCDSNGLTTLINAKARELCGFGEVSIGFDEWDNHVKLYDSKTHKLLKRDQNPLFRVLNGEKLHDLEITFETVSGKVRHTAIYGSSLLSVENKAVGAIISIHDKSDRVLAEIKKEEASAYARSLIEASLDPMITIDAEGRISDVNKATTLVTGESREDLIGSNFFAYFTDSEAAREAYRLVWSQGSLRDFSLALRHKNGKVTEVLYNAAIYQNSDGRPLGVFAAARDITKQKEYERQLTQALVTADTANKAKSQFLASMSHEIRTPLNSLLGLTEVLLERNFTQEQREHLKVVEAASENLLCLVNDILDLARVEAGALVVEKIPFSLADQIESCLAIIKPRASEKGLKVSCEVDSRLPFGVMGDPTRLRQIILNLLSNAVKFSDCGEIFVKAGIAFETEGPDRILISVRDQGIGISKDKFEKIFERFSQIDSSVTRRFGGSGLGLTISKKLVELMEGRIWVDSQVGQGSVFYFTAHLPRQEKVPSLILNESSYVNDEGDFKNFRQIKIETESEEPVEILLVEDSKENRILIKAFLRDQKINVTEVENGLEAVEIYKSKKFDIIFMDVQMPIMDGYAATQEIRKWEVKKARKPVPILALTAHAFEDDSRASEVAGCTEHITKPIKKSKLLELIRKYVYY